MSEVKETYDRILQATRGLNIRDTEKERLFKECSDTAMKSLLNENEWYLQKKDKFNNVSKSAQAVNLLVSAITVASEGTPIPTLPIFATLKEAGVVGDIYSVKENMSRITTLLDDVERVGDAKEKEDKDFSERLKKAQYQILQSVKSHIEDFVKIRALELGKTEELITKTIKEKEAERQAKIDKRNARKAKRK